MSDRMFYIVIILLIVLLGLVMLVAWVSDFGLEDDGYPDPAVGDYSSTVSREFVYEEETIELDIPFWESRPYGDSSHPRLIPALVMYDDPCIQRIADYLVSVTDGTDLSRVSAVISFVKENVSYLSDRDQGHEDYWQAATQTLRIGTGDYEDLSILAVSILNAMGYDCVFILEPQVRFGVDMECPDGVDGFYYHTELDGSEYTSVNIMLRDPFDCAVREIKLVPDWFEGPSHPVQQEVERWSGSS